MISYKKYIICCLLGLILGIIIMSVFFPYKPTYDQTIYDKVHENNQLIIDSLNKETEILKSSNKLLLDEAKNYEQENVDLMILNQREKDEIDRLKKIVSTLSKKKTSNDSLLFELQQKMKNI